MLPIPVFRRGGYYPPVEQDSGLEPPPLFSGCLNSGHPLCPDPGGAKTLCFLITYTNPAYIAPTGIAPGQRPQAAELLLWGGAYNLREAPARGKHPSKNPRGWWQPGELNPHKPGLMHPAPSPVLPRRGGYYPPGLDLNSSSSFLSPCQLGLLNLILWTASPAFFTQPPLSIAKGKSSLIASTWVSSSFTK